METGSVRALQEEILKLKAERMVFNQRIDSQIFRREKALEAMGIRKAPIGFGGVTKQLKFKLPVAVIGKAGKSGHSGLTDAVLNELKEAGKAVPSSVIKNELGEQFGSKNLNVRVYIALDRLEKRGQIVRLKDGGKVLWKLK